MFETGRKRIDFEPCGFAAGIVGALPSAWTRGPPSIRRQTIATAPISATMRAKMLDKLIAFFPWPMVARKLAEADARWNRRYAAFTGESGRRELSVGGEARKGRLARLQSARQRPERRRMVGYSAG
jgi:hypothetical protein